MHWKAGTAKAIITPETSVWLAGYGTKRAPEGKLHDLWLKVLALEDPNGRDVVLITSDHMGIPRVMYESMFKKLNERFELERSQVMFTFSHNHCGPRLREDLVDYYPVDPMQTKLVTDYSDIVETLTVETVAHALSDLTPARLSIGEGITTFAVNRRDTPESEVPRLLANGDPLKGVVDHSVPVLTVHNKADQLCAVLFGYACHPTTLNFTNWCGDYPGFAQINIEKRHPGTSAMFFNTCGGDQNPLPRRSVELCERYGHMLSEAVEAVLNRPLQPVLADLRTAFEFTDLVYQKVMSRPELEKSCSSQNAIHARWAKRMLNKLDSGETFASSYSYPIQVCKFGNELLLIGMGGEAVVDYSLRFKKEFGMHTWVCGYSNDLVAYIPSWRVWQEGGYEGGPHLDEYGHPALRWAGDVEERIAAAVARLVYEVNRGTAARLER